MPWLKNLLAIYRVPVLAIGFDNIFVYGVNGIYCLVVEHHCQRTVGGKRRGNGQVSASGWHVGAPLVGVVELVNPVGVPFDDILVVIS